MQRRQLHLCLLPLIGSLVFGLLCSEADALVLHPDSEPPADWTDHPPDAVIAAWNSPQTTATGKASAVAIGPNTLITTIHQRGGISTGITIAGEEFVVSDEISLIDGTTPIDLRLVTITTPGGQPANLEQFVPLYTGHSYTHEVVIGGTGRVRGPELIDDPDGDGYAWSGQRDLLWATNRSEGRVITQTETTRTLTLVGDFDLPGIDEATEYEAIMADHDSGGGWFVMNNGQWQLLGVSAYVQTQNKSLYDPRDWLRAVSMRKYRDLVEAELSTAAVPIGDANWDGIVDGDDLAILEANLGLTGLDLAESWRRGDFNADGAVSFADFALLSNHFGTDWTGGKPTGVSGTDQAVRIAEPTSLLLLAAAAGLGLRRRR